jgi:hypothetical protein
MITIWTSSDIEGALMGLVEKYPINAVIRALANVAEAEADGIREHRMPSGNPSINIDGPARAQVDALERFAESYRRFGREV